MLPKTTEKIQDFTYQDIPTRTFRIDWETGRIAGFIHSLEAVKQAIHLILSTERYDYVIHSWNYGTELKNLTGQEKTLVYARLQSAVQQALMQDSRIRAVDSFAFSADGNTVHMSFQAHTSYGDIEVEKEVEI